jgi:uncharacterized protein (TIGR01777 family)
MRVGITGASGLIGSALVAHLRSGEHHVVKIVRRSPAGDEIRWDPSGAGIDSNQLVGLDAIVHLAGAGIGDKRWTDDYKQEILNSRVAGTTTIAEAMAGRADGPQVLLSGSAIGIYGSRDDHVLDEQSAAGDDFLAGVCTAWEAATLAASDAGVRVVHLRTGIVLSPDGGALKKMLPLFKLGAGGRFGSGKQWMSWITLHDEVRAIEHLLTSSVHGPVNLTAPNPVTNRDFAQALGKTLHRPSLFPVPGFGPKLLLGQELAESLLFASQRVTPTALRNDGYTFDHPELGAALQAILDS